MVYAQNNPWDPVYTRANISPLLLIPLIFHLTSQLFNQTYSYDVRQKIWQLTSEDHPGQFFARCSWAPQGVQFHTQRHLVFFLMLVLVLGCDHLALMLHELLDTPSWDILSQMICKYLVVIRYVFFCYPLLCIIFGLACIWKSVLINLKISS